MRIGFDAKRAFNNHRGLGNYSRETIRILTSCSPDHRYFLFTPRIDPSIDFSCPSNTSIVQPNAPSGKLSQSVWRTLRLAKEATRLELDIYHGLSHELPYGIEKSKVKTVLTMHDLTFLKHPEWFPFIDRMLYRKKYLDSCRKADHIVAISEQTKRDLLELTDVESRKVSVVYQGCSPLFREQVTDEKKRQLKERYALPDAFLLNVAAMEPRKNQKAILEALASGTVDLPLVIAGRKTVYTKELQQFAVEKKIQNRVIWLPDVPFSDLPVLYQCATLFVFPSFYEGFGIPIVEALESRLPVIASQGSCLEESGGPDSIYVDPHDIEALAQGIKQLIDDSEERKRMAVKGKAYAQRFSDQNINDTLFRIYKTIQS